jgi:hypothetical protein
MTASTATVHQYLTERNLVKPGADPGDFFQRVTLLYDGQCNILHDIVNSIRFIQAASYDSTQPPFMFQENTLWTDTRHNCTSPWSLECLIIPGKRPAFSEAQPLSCGWYGRIVAAGGSFPEVFFQNLLISVIPACAGMTENQNYVLSNDSAGFRGFTLHDCWFL